MPFCGICYTNTHKEGSLKFLLILLGKWYKKKVPDRWINLTCLDRLNEDNYVDEENLYYLYDLCITSKT